MRNTSTAILIALILTIVQAATCAAEAREQVVAGPGSSDAPSSPDSGSPTGSPPPEWLADLMLCAVCEANPPGGFYWSCEYFCMHSAADFLNKCNQAGRTCYSIGVHNPVRGLPGHQVNMVEDPTGTCRFVDTTSGNITIGDMTFPCNKPPEKAICQIMGLPDNCGWKMGGRPSPSPEAPWTEAICSQKRYDNRNAIPISQEQKAEGCADCCVVHASVFYIGGARRPQPGQVQPGNGASEEEQRRYIRGLDPRDIISGQVDMTRQWYERCINSCSSKFGNPNETDPGARFAITVCGAFQEAAKANPEQELNGQQCRTCCEDFALLPSYPPASKPQCIGRCNAVYGPPKKTRRGGGPFSRRGS